MTVFLCSGLLAAAPPQICTPSSVFFSFYSDLCNTIFTYHIRRLFLADLGPGDDSCALSWPCFAGGIYSGLFAVDLTHAVTAWVDCLKWQSACLALRHWLSDGPANSAKPRDYWAICLRQGCQFVVLMRSTINNNNNNNNRISMSML